jgi:hypothetical protein
MEWGHRYLSELEYMMERDEMKEIFCTMVPKRNVHLLPGNWDKLTLPFDRTDYCGPWYVENDGRPMPRRCGLCIYGCVREVACNDELSYALVAYVSK